MEAGWAKRECNKILAEEERRQNPASAIYVCSVCGDTIEADADNEDWLIANALGSTSGEMVIRCPEHITEYAIRKCGGRIETRNGVKRGVVNHYEYIIY